MRPVCRTCGRLATVCITLPDFRTVDACDEHVDAIEAYPHVCPWWACRRAYRSEWRLTLHILYRRLTREHLHAV